MGQSLRNVHSKRCFLFLFLFELHSTQLHGTNTSTSTLPRQLLGSNCPHEACSVVHFLLSSTTLRRTTLRCFCFHVTRCTTRGPCNGEERSICFSIINPSPQQLWECPVNASCVLTRSWFVVPSQVLKNGFPSPWVLPGKQMFSWLTFFTYVYPERVYQSKRIGRLLFFSYTHRFVDLHAILLSGCPSERVLLKKPILLVGGWADANQLNLM